MAFLLDKAIVRIRTPEGAVAGAGFLVAPRLILTCWHVACAALEGEWLRLDLPNVAPGKPLRARLEKYDEAGDMALLRLAEDPPENARPVRLVMATEVWGHNFRAFGFPGGFDDGRWAGGRMRAPIGDTGWLQLDHAPEFAYLVQRGFSGTAVWDEDVRGVVGMVVTVDQPWPAACCIPTARLLDFCPELRDQALPANPYRGLLAFREQDAPFFFGREAAVAELLARVERRPLTAVIGPSGCGKSSLVQAGLLPRLRARPEWLLVPPMRPGENPFAELARSLIPLLEPGMSETDRLLEASKLADSLRKDEVTLEAVVRRILEKAGGEHLFLLVDQWEELYDPRLDEVVRRAFVDVLLAGIRARNSPCAWS